MYVLQSKLERGILSIANRSHDEGFILLDAIGAFLLISLMSLSLIPACIWLIEERRAIDEELSLLYDLEKSRLSYHSGSQKAWEQIGDDSMYRKCQESHLKRNKALCVYVLEK